MWRIVIRAVNYFSGSALHGAQLSSWSIYEFIFCPLQCYIGRYLDNNNTNLFQIRKNVAKLKMCCLLFDFPSCTSF